MAYKVLYQDDRIEVRKYPPVNRTLLVGKSGYFVPFPYQVYIAALSKEGGLKRYLYTSFAKADDEFMYPTPFHPINTPVCMDMDWHYHIPNNVDMSEGIRRYWSTYFYSHSGYLRHIFKVRTLDEWSRLTRRQVICRLKHGKRHLNKFINGFQPPYYPFKAK